MIPIDPATLLAGARLPHGDHERRDQGWDPQLRERHGDAPDALSYGRHAATRTEDRRPER